VRNDITQPQDADQELGIPKLVSNNDSDAEQLKSSHGQRLDVPFLQTARQSALNRLKITGRWRVLHQLIDRLARAASSFLI
jgi:hypothetical protein